MSDFILYTFEDEGTSIWVMAQDIKQAFEELGIEVDIHTGKSFKEFNKKHVLSLREHTTGKVMQAKRFMGMKTYTAMHTRHFNELTEAEWIGMMAQFYKGKSGAQPIRMIAMSPHTWQEIRERIARYFSPGVGKKILENTKQISYGVASMFTDTDKNNPDLFIVPFNRPKSTMMSALNRVTMETNVMIGRTGRKVQHHFRHAPGYGPERLPSWDASMYVVEEQPKLREQYAEQARNYGIAISVSESETFGLYFLELLMSGVVVVFRDAPWVRKLLPGYQYMYEMKHLSTGVYNVWCKYDEARKYLQSTVQPYIREHYTVKHFVQSYLKLIGELDDGNTCLQ